MQGSRTTDFLCYFDHRHRIFAASDVAGSRRENIWPLGFDNHDVDDELSYLRYVFCPGVKFGYYDQRKKEKFAYIFK